MPQAEAFAAFLHSSVVNAGLIARPGRAPADSEPRSTARRGRRLSRASAGVLHDQVAYARKRRLDVLASSRPHRAVRLDDHRSVRSLGTLVGDREQVLGDLIAILGQIVAEHPATR